jgi:WD40 repeat protein
MEFDQGSGKAAGGPAPMILPTQNCTALKISRDGTKYIYVSSDLRGNIFKVPFDPARLKLSGPPVAVTEGSREFGYLSVSPDGKSLAFSIMGIQEDLGIIGTDGKGFRKLTNDRPKDRGPSWSNDGKQIAFYSERGGNYQIWTVNTDGSGFKQISNDTSTSAIAYPIWLPGRNTIYYQRDGSGALIELRDGEPVKTTRLPDYLKETSWGGISFSPDGRSMVGGTTRADGTSGGIVLFSTADSSFTKILDHGDRPIWLRDGRTIVFLYAGKLRLLDVPTKQVTTLDGLPPVTAEWLFTISPDDRTIYYVKTESEGDIWQAQVQ